MQGQILECVGPTYWKFRNATKLFTAWKQKRVLCHSNKSMDRSPLYVSIGMQWFAVGHDLVYSTFYCPCIHSYIFLIFIKPLSNQGVSTSQPRIQMQLVASFNMACSKSLPSDPWQASEKPISCSPPAYPQERQPPAPPPQNVSLVHSISKPPP